ncbi:hypothetical protein SAMN05660686_02438 [Thalassobaculum litoreum DSM 18839]|uniref:Uncharacterized protein n=2 Tax=Thalassobaculum TaxID=526215 RepID=A0A8G2BHZ4_9PROT|nr:hypothetical protein SAMN05660686_02438 [Thalassobaculum litoreum DSM 18839]
MARPRKSEEVEVLANVADREAAQQAAFEKRYKLECEIAALKEKHIKPLQTEISTITGRLADQLQTARKYINAAYKPYALARDADDFDDEDEGKEVRDQIRALFNGLHKNGMLDLVEIAEAASGKKGGGKKAQAKADNVVQMSKPAAEEPVQDDLIDENADSRDPESDSSFITARASGQNAARAGSSFNDNPYEKGSGEATAFEIGFLKEQGALAHAGGKSLNDNPSTEGTDGWAYWRKGWQAAADAEFSGKTPISAGDGDDEIAPEEFDDELAGDGKVQAAE